MKKFNNVKNNYPFIKYRLKIYIFTLQRTIFENVS